MSPNDAAPNDAAPNEDAPNEDDIAPSARKQIAGVFKQIRIENGLSIEEMAELLGLLPTTLRTYENGRFPARHHLLELLDLWGVPKKRRSAILQVFPETERSPGKARQPSQRPIPSHEPHVPASHSIAQPGSLPAELLRSYAREGRVRAWRPEQVKRGSEPVRSQKLHPDRETSKVGTTSPTFSEVYQIAGIDLGKAVRRLRVRRGLTQIELARRLRKPESDIAALEAGELPVASSYVESIARACGVRIGFIVRTARAIAAPAPTMQEAEAQAEIPSVAVPRGEYVTASQAERILGASNNQIRYLIKIGVIGGPKAEGNCVALLLHRADVFGLRDSRRPLPDVVDATEAAEVAGIPIKGVYDAVHEHRLSCVRNGKRLIFLKSEVARVFSPDRHTPPVPAPNPSRAYTTPRFEVQLLSFDPELGIVGPHVQTATTRMIDRYIHGQPGGTLIDGEPQSGRTVAAQYAFSQARQWGFGSLFIDLLKVPTTAVDIGLRHYLSRDQSDWSAFRELVSEIEQWTAHNGTRGNVIVIDSVNALGAKGALAIGRLVSEFQMRTLNTRTANQAGVQFYLAMTSRGPTKPQELNPHELFHGLGTDYSGPLDAEHILRLAGAQPDRSAGVWLSGAAEEALELFGGRPRLTNAYLRTRVRGTSVQETLRLIAPEIADFAAVARATVEIQQRGRFYFGSKLEEDLPKIEELLANPNIALSRIDAPITRTGSTSDTSDDVDGRSWVRATEVRSLLSATDDQIRWLVHSEQLKVKKWSDRFLDLQLDAQGVADYSVSGQELPDVLTSRQVVELAGTSILALRAAALEGIIVPTNVGYRRWLFVRSEIESVLSSERWAQLTAEIQAGCFNAMGQRLRGKRGQLLQERARGNRQAIGRASDDGYEAVAEPQAVAEPRPVAEPQPVAEPLDRSERPRRLFSQAPSGRLLVMYAGDLRDGRGVVTDMSGLELETLLDTNCELVSLLTEKNIDRRTCEPLVDRMASDIASTIEHRYHDFDGFLIVTSPVSTPYLGGMVSFMISGSAKPITFAGGAFVPGHPHGEQTSIDIRGGIALSRLGLRLPRPIDELFAVNNGNIFRANRTTIGKGGDVRVLVSPSFGTLGIIERDQTPQLYSSRLRGLPAGAEIRIDTRHNAEVLVTGIYPGLDPRLLARQLGNSRSVLLDPIGGLQVQQYLVPVIESLCAAGSIVVIAGNGADLTEHQTGRQLVNAGVLSNGDMPPEVTLAKLQKLTGQNLNNAAVREAFHADLRGERSPLTLSPVDLGVGPA